MKLLIISLFFTSITQGQVIKTITIDSVGKKRGCSVELFSNDTCYLYTWRGMGKVNVKVGQIATVNSPTRKLKYYWISLKK